MRVHALVPFACLAGLLAQEVALKLPAVLRLGSVPANARIVTLDGDGAATAAELTALPAGTTEFVLRADRWTPMVVVQRLFDDAQQRGIGKVFLLATLRDGKQGAVTLALPMAKDAPCTVTMRAHRDRPGVPPESAIPLLRRFRDGWEAHRPGEFTLGLVLPANATYGQFLPLLASAAEARVPRVVVTTGEAADNADAAAALALDLESSFLLQVQPREQVSTTGIVDAPFGVNTRATATATNEDTGRVGGRYGGRGGRGRPPNATEEAMVVALQRGLDWLARQQLPNGAFADRFGQGDVEGTALAVLVLLSPGSTLDSGADTDPLRRAVGWLLARQHDDGRFSDSGPEANRHHALATFALTEAAGMSVRGPLFRGSAQLALDWLLAERRPDGGFNDGVPAATSDSLSTGAALLCVSSAKFFGLRCEATCAELVAWFDGHPTTDARLGGVELLSRFQAGQPREHERVAALVPRVAEHADATDPLACYWASYALFRAGGKAWRQWVPRLGQIVASQTTNGPDAGSWPFAGKPSLPATARFLWALSAGHRQSRIVFR